MVRKPDSVERNEWVELSASAKKKLVKNIELWRKKEAKLAKEGERLEKERQGAEERDRLRREEAKSIVLVDDASKGEAKKVCPGFPSRQNGRHNSYADMHEEQVLWRP
jgi:asparaginyl-tRNA synthetase